MPVFVLSERTTRAAQAPSHTPVVSVIMPCRDGAVTLREAILSIQQQTLAGWELIVVDDGSTDDSRQVIQKFASSDKRIVLICSEPVGIVEALRLGCSAARAPYLARMDADDVSLPQRLEAQLRLMNSDPTLGLTGCGVEEIGASPALGRADYMAWLASIHTSEDIARNAFIECPIPHPTFFIRRTAFEDCGGYEDRGWAEDYDLVLRMLQGGWRLAKVKQPRLLWRENAQRLSRTNPRYSLASFRACKRHYLRTGPLSGDRPFYQWGAGMVGKDWLREWGTHRPEAVVDIHPRRVGNLVHGTLVIAPDQLPPPQQAFVVVTVGTPSARPVIRERLIRRGFQELRDFVFVS